MAITGYTPNRQDLDFTHVEHAPLNIHQYAALQIILLYSGQAQEARAADVDGVRRWGADDWRAAKNGIIGDAPQIWANTSVK